MNLRRVETGVVIDLPAPTPPLPISVILGIGMNYAEHAKEQGKGIPERPVLFAKNPFAACLDAEDIVVPHICHEPSQMDLEAELGVIIGRRPNGALVRDVPLDEALACVLGYVAANDVSARWWQKEGSGGQFCRGKSFDTFCPIGPRVIPAAEVPNPNALRIQSRLNGMPMQDANTSDMIFNIATLIHELSRGLTLLPGTLILTGTPSGVGMARKPPVFLRDGDVVEVEIESIGTIRNRVRFE